MLYLIGSIVFTSWITLAFKLVERWKLKNLQVIVFNYIGCIITGSFMNGYFPMTRGILYEPWIGWALLMGIVFFTLFNVIAFTTQKVGVAVTSVANKLSMIIPFLFSLYLYNEKATILKITGIVIALAAVILTCWPAEKNKDKSAGRNPLLWVMPVLLFIGSGLLDTMIKYVEQGFMNDNNKNDFLITAFTVAACVGAVVLMVQIVRGRQTFSGKAVVAGFSIGIPNYLAIWCLVHVLKNYANNSSAIIPINNMSIVLFSAVMAWILFKERLSLINWVGIVLAMLAIGLISAPT